MKLFSFWYDKNKDNNPKIRFLAVKSSDNTHLHGYDLLDNNTYKSFLRSKISGPIADWGDESESFFLGGKVLDIYEVLTELNYNLSIVELVDYNKIVAMYKKNTGNNIIALTSGYFFKSGPVVVDIGMLVGNQKVNMKVSEGVIEFFCEDNKITHLDFTRMVLGIKE